MVRSSPESGQSLSDGWYSSIGVDFDIALTPIWGKVETHHQDQVPDYQLCIVQDERGDLREDEGTSTMIVASSFDIGIGQQEDG